MLLKHLLSEQAEIKPVVKISMVMLKRTQQAVLTSMDGEKYCSKHG